MTCPCSGPKCRLDADDERHGTENAYRYHWCRCAPCRADATAAARERRERREQRIADAVGVTLVREVVPSKPSRLAPERQRIKAAKAACVEARLRALRAPQPSIRRAMLELIKPIEAELRKDVA